MGDDHTVTDAVKDGDMGASAGVSARAGGDTVFCPMPNAGPDAGRGVLQYAPTHAGPLQHASTWPMVPLGTVASPIARPEIPTAGQTYRQIGVRLWGEGAYERESIDGSQTKYGTLSRVAANDIIVNKIWARNGSVAVVPAALDGCYASTEFPTFAPIREALEPRWFHWFTKTPGFWAQCDAKSRGTSGKNRIRPERFLEIEVPLPPLDEQRRIVVRIEELTGKIEEARELRRQAVEETSAILPAAAHRALSSLADKYGSVPLLDLCSFVGGSQPPKSTFRYEPAPGYVRFLQIRDYSSDSHLTYIPVSPRNRLVDAREILVGRYGASLGKVLRGKEGAYNVAMCKSVPKTDQLDIDFSAIVLQYGQFQDRLKQISRSAQVGFNKSDLKGVAFAMPPISEQRNLVAQMNYLHTQAATLKHVQAETAAGLDALLPALLDKAFKGEL